jgi:hypothetical protein
MIYKFNIQKVSAAEVEIEAESLEEAMSKSNTMDIDYEDTGLRILDYDSLLINMITLSEQDIAFLETIYPD